MLRHKQPVVFPFILIQRRYRPHFIGLAKGSQDYLFRKSKHEDFGDTPIAPARFREKRENHARSLLEAQSDMSAVFGKHATNVLTSNIKAKTVADDRFQSDVLKAYRLLRPQSLVDYQESSQIGLLSRLNSLTLPSSPLMTDQNPDNTSIMLKSTCHSEAPEPLNMNLPIVNPRAFVLAVEAVCNSLANDLERLCRLLGVVGLPEKEDPLRFQHCVDRLFRFFQLEKNPEKVEKWLSRVWPKVKRFLPDEIRQLGSKTIEYWLVEHIKRVIKHQPKELKREPWYDLGRDFIYDDLPLPENYIDQRQFDFPFEQSEKYFLNLLSFFGIRQTHQMKTIAQQFQQLVWDLKKIGLTEWVHVEKQKLLRKLPRDAPPRFNASQQDIEIQEEIEEFPENPFISDRDIDYFCNISKSASRISSERNCEEPLNKETGKNNETSIDRLLRITKKEVSTAGPLEWLEDGDRFVTWRWKKPEGAQLDSSTGCYVRDADGLNPGLNTTQLRTCVLKHQRMKLNGGAGTIFYFRVLVAVGDAKGYFGTACGFGYTLGQATKDAVMKAMRNANFIDHDAGRILCTPVRGKEYSSFVKFYFRKAGKGLKVKGRHLPLAFLMGFQNMRLSFGGNRNWLSRHRALRRACEAVQSRRTLANATGQKYALLASPGDHWVHWPDKWFTPISKDYDEKINSIKKQEKQIWTRNKRSNLVDVLPDNLLDTNNVLTKSSPLATWAGLQKRIKLSNYGVYQTEMMNSATRKSQGPKVLMQKSTPGRTVPVIRRTS